MYINVFGCDWSMTSPAMCHYKGEQSEFNFQSCSLFSLCDYKIEDFDNFYFERHKFFDCQMERFDNIAEWALQYTGEHDPNDVDVIGIEDYSMGSSGRIFHIAENTGIFKHELWKKGFKIETIPPTVIKKFATGKGSGKKDKMYEQFVSETGIDLKEILQPKRLLGSPTTDIIDSYFIAKYVALSKIPH